VQVVDAAETPGSDRPRRVLDVDVAPAEAGQINTGLVQAGFVVSELRWCPPDLEAMFLDLTGGHRDVA
jgi:ABC-2 type transport system ATP-binding protein